MRLQERLPDAFKTSLRRLVKTSSKHVEDILRIFSRVFKTSSKRLTKTSSRHLQDVLQICLQELFKTDQIFKTQKF